MKKRDRVSLFLFLLPTILVLLLLLIYPMIYVWRVSFDSYSLTSPEDRHFVGLMNFISLFRDSKFIKGLGRALYFTAMSVTATFLIGFSVALLLNSKAVIGKSFFQNTYIIPMVLTPYVIGQTWRFLLDFTYGPIQHLITSLGIRKLNFLGEPALAMNTSILVDVWQWTPFVIIILLAGLESIPKELLESARVDGASRWQEFWFVKVPLLKSAITSVILIRLMDAFREFDKVFALTAGGPGTSTELLSLYVYKTGFQYFHMGKSAAMALFMIISIVIISNIFINRTGVMQQERVV